jgi:hypothetical protein
MTITADTANQLDALGLEIFNLNLQPNAPGQEALGEHFDPTRYTGIKGQDDAIDAQYLALIAPVMLAIDGRVMAPGFKYTLNFTNALQGRPMHWYIEGLSEFVPSVLPPVNIGFLCSPAPPALPSGDYGSYGFYLAGAACAGICHIWATIIRLWLAGNYPLAVSLPK